MNKKFWLVFCIEAIIFALLLFGSAGTILWPAAWALMILYFGIGLLVSIDLAKHDPTLLQERMKSPFQKGQPLWDKIFISVLLILWPCWLILMGLDAGRFGWSSMPVWLQGVGGIGLIISFWIIYRAFRENTFLIAVVKIQKERAHKVITTGPYAIVRHPVYAGALILLPSTALLLGSWYGVIASVFLMAGMVFRTVMEDRELNRGLEGYNDYAKRVKYRLIPYVW